MALVNTTLPGGGVIVTNSPAVSGPAGARLDANALALAAALPPVFQPLTGVANVFNWTLAASSVLCLASLTLTAGVGTVTLGAVAPVAGGLYTLFVTNGTSGSGTLTWSGNFVWPAGNVPALSAGANNLDIFQFISDGSNLILTNHTTGAPPMTFKNMVLNGGQSGSAGVPYIYLRMDDASGQAANIGSFGAMGWYGQINGTTQIYQVAGSLAGGGDSDTAMEFPANVNMGTWNVAAWPQGRATITQRIRLKYDQGIQPIYAPGVRNGWDYGGFGFNSGTGAATLTASLELASSTTATYDINASYGDGNWHEFVMTYDNSGGLGTFCVYADGVLLYTHNYGNLALGTDYNRFSIGNTWSGGSGTPIYVDEYSAHPSAMSAADALKLANRGVSTHY